MNADTLTTERMLYPTYKRLMSAGTPMATERAATLARRYPALRAALARELGL